MPRQISQPSTLYPPGIYGPFRLDSFTAGDAQGVEASLTVESWPDVSPLFTITLAFSNGMTQVLPVSGRPRARDGSLLSVYTTRVDFPEDAVNDGSGGFTKTRRPTVSCDVTVQAHQAFRTAITLRAI